MCIVWQLCTFSRRSCKQCELSPLHVNQKSKSDYFCVLREGYYVMIWPIVRICVFIKDWKLIYSEYFILNRKSMDNSGGSWHKLCSMHLPVKHKWFFSQALEFRTPLFPHLVPPAIMVWIFVWKYIFEPFIHILQHFVLQLSRSTNLCF
jgi:hypothetical protein